MPTTSAARTKLQDATDWAPLTCKLWSGCEPGSELQTRDSVALRPCAKSLTQKHRPDIQSHDNSSSRWAFFAYNVRCGHPVRPGLRGPMIARRIIGHLPEIGRVAGLALGG